MKGQRSRVVRIKPETARRLEAFRRPEDRSVNDLVTRVIRMADEQRNKRGGLKR